jgi:hypothetical protein
MWTRMKLDGIMNFDAQRKSEVAVAQKIDM